MEGEGDEDECPLEHANEREGVEELDLLGVGEGAVEGLEVGDDVLDEEGADGDDAGEGVQLAPEEGVSFTGAERLHASNRRCGGRCWRCGCGHEGLLRSVRECTATEFVQHRDYSALVLPASRKLAGFVRLSLGLCEIVWTHLS